MYCYNIYLLRVHDSQVYKNNKKTSVCKSLILFVREKMMSCQKVFSFVDAAVSYTALASVSCFLSIIWDDGTKIQYLIQGVALKWLNDLQTKLILCHEELFSHYILFNCLILKKEVHTCLYHLSKIVNLIFFELQLNALMVFKYWIMFQTKYRLLTFPVFSN